MRSRIILAAILTFTVWAGTVHAQQLQSQPKAPSSSAPQTETIEAASPAATVQQPARAGETFMTPAQVKEVLHKLWMAEFRVNDLLTEVHPERWKLSDVARTSFGDTFAALREQLQSVEGWRSQFDTRPDSVYLGFMTYAAINAALPRLDGVTRGVTQHENPSLGAQFSQAGNRLFDLQQALQPYLAYLLHNQDEVLLATQTNLAGCQNQLSYAMRGKTEVAKPMKNVLPEFKGRRRNRLASPKGSSEPASQAAPRPGQAPPKK